MPEEPRQMLVYRILRYMPNVPRDEWVNIGVLLEEPATARRDARLIEEQRQITRVRQIHPDADQDFLRRRVPGIERNVPVEDFTEPGDPLKLDYAYCNGVRGYMQVLTLGRDPAHAKVLAFTAERIRERLGECEFTAITEAEPDVEKPRHQFIRRLLDDQAIEIVSVNRIEKFAEELRARLQ